MARLVAVCREGEEDYPFLSRQIPLYIDDTLTVSVFSFVHVHEVTDSCTSLCVCSCTLHELSGGFIPVQEECLIDLTLHQIRRC